MGMNFQKAPEILSLYKWWYLDFAKLNAFIDIKSNVTYQ